MTVVLSSSGPISRIIDLPEELARRINARAHVPGDLVAGRFKLLESLGNGGMGQVFIAENLSIGRRVAIKTLKAEHLANGEFRKRFQQEAETLAAVEHRNVARFLDLIVGDPTFLVMEYVKGPTLGAVLKQETRLDPLRAINIVKRICWGLDAAHTAGVVHRDVKPANIILAPDAEVGEEPKLIDFGLAKLMLAPPGEQLTRTGQIIGTPHYMSPEQILRRDIDARSDVYSLACVLYHLVTGRPPFVGDDMEVVYQQMQGTPDPIRRLAPEAPSALERVLTSALAKSPSQRYGSTREMAEALAQIDQPHPVRGPEGNAINNRRPLVDGSGRHTSVAPRPQRPRPSRRKWVAVAAAVVVSLIAIAVPLHRRAAHTVAPATDAILILSQPSGAAVELDGRLLGEVTPTMVPDVGVGKHTVRLSSPGYAAVEQLVELKPGDKVGVDVVLPPASRNVEVQTDPSGALVYLDGHLVAGQTPLHLELSEDDFHEVRIEKTGYELASESIKPEDRRAQLYFALAVERQPHGTVWVDAGRVAQVFIDGANSGLVTPTPGIQVPVGEHLIELREGRSGEQRLAGAKVKLVRGQTVHLNLGLGAPGR